MEDDHWLNQPLAVESPEAAGQLLLQVATQQPDPTFTKLLIRAGARAEAYNDQLSQVRRGNILMSTSSRLLFRPIFLQQLYNVVEYLCKYTYISLLIDVFL